MRFTKPLKSRNRREERFTPWNPAFHYLGTEPAATRRGRPEKDGCWNTPPALRPATERSIDPNDGHDSKCTDSRPRHIHLGVDGNGRHHYLSHTETIYVVDGADVVHREDITDRHADEWMAFVDQRVDDGWKTKDYGVFWERLAEAFGERTTEGEVRRCTWTASNSSISRGAAHPDASASSQRVTARSVRRPSGRVVRGVSRARNR